MPAGDRTGIRVVCALREEARPLIARWKLDRLHGTAPFRAYRRGERWLLVSGVGKLAAATGAGYLHALCGGGSAAGWINFGVAAHASRPVGEAVLAERVRDAASGRWWRLVVPDEPPCAIGTVTTLDELVQRPDDGPVFDMEAAGFCAAAARLTTRPRVHVLKVISDHGVGASERLSGEAISELVERRLDGLEWLADQLQSSKPG